MFTKDPSPGSRRDSTHAEAVEHVAGGGVAIYWRPGCPFCSALERGLEEDAAAAAWTNIWVDPDALVFVESLNDGNATVPTVVAGGEHFVAASPAAVAATRALLTGPRRSP